MKISDKYSEFSFGYAFTENLIRSSSAGVKGTPYFPNLVEEGKLGYDLKLKFKTITLFFQYKLPELMVRSTAVEISKYRLHARGLPRPFFRMSLTRNDVSEQHELLVKLDNRCPDCVFYVVPFLKSEDELNEAYMNVEVHKRALLFSPRDIGPLPDSKQHTVAFHNNPRCAWLCSNPKNITAYTVDDVANERVSSKEALPLRLQVDSIVTAINETAWEANPRQFEKLRASARKRIREIRRRAVDFGGRANQIDSETESTIEELLVARELARVGLGLDLLPVQRRD